MRATSNGRVRIDRGDGMQFWIAPSEVDRFIARNPGASKVRSAGAVEPVEPGDVEDGDEIATRSRSRK